MSWIRDGCFRPPPQLAGLEESDSSSSSYSSSSMMMMEKKSMERQEEIGSSSMAHSPTTTPHNKRRCPLHKLIRHHKWPAVVICSRQDPSQISHVNDHGWSSLTLALYHAAPLGVMTHMFDLLSLSEAIHLLSSPVPNGGRLCLHFAARYADSVDLLELIATPYPSALLCRSHDGVTPLERAVYYRKAPPLQAYLREATTHQRNFERLKAFNEQMRWTVLLSCWHRHNHSISNENPVATTRTIVPTPTKSGKTNSIVTNHTETKERDATAADFMVELYAYSKDRELIGLFWNVLGYVGVSSLPPDEDG